MSAPELTEPTRSAHWGWDEHRYFGHRVFEELGGRETLTGVTVLSVLGRRLPQQACAVIDDATTTLLLADPRIWPLKLTRVVAAYGATLPAVAAGLLTEENGRIGPWAAAKAAEVLLELRAATRGRTDEEAVSGAVRRYLEGQRFVWGFGTPFRERDERLVAFRACIGRRARGSLPFWTLMSAVVPIVRELRGPEPNIGLGVAAAFLDLGLTPHEIGALTSAIMHPMFLAHAIEASRSRLLAELPERCVTYVGTAPRRSPRAEDEARRSG